MLAASSAPYSAKELTLPRGHAYYATFEDPNLVGKPPIRGDYKFSTSCVILFEGGVLANATVFTDEASGATFQEALQIVEKLELAPEPAAPTAVLVNGHITLALSTLDTALVLPTGFTLQPGANAHFLAQGPDGLIISGWIEPKEQYPGFRALWQRDRQRMTAGGRLALQGEKFETIAGWDAVFYTIRLAADATQLNLRACCTRGTAWFDVHLSCTGKAPRLEALRAVLRELTWQPQAKR